MKLISFLLVYFLGRSLGIAQETNLTDAALAAYERCALGEISNHIETVTLKYKGVSGDERTVACSYKVTMTLTFKGPTITGSFSYENNKLTIPVEGKEDARGNIILRQILPDGNVNYVLKGVRYEHAIMGGWSKGAGKKGYAVYLVLEAPTPPSVHPPSDKVK